MVFNLKNISYKKKMVTKKGGTILLNLKTKQIGLIYRNHYKDYSFPKGHLEKGETLEECAVRETEEETLRSNTLLSNTPLYILKYTTPLSEDVETYMYITIDNGPTTKNIALEDRENLEWVNLEEVENKLSYDNLKKFWIDIKPKIQEIFEKNQTSFNS